VYYPTTEGAALSRHSVNTALHQLEDTDKILAAVDKARLDALNRKARFSVVPDGFPASVGGSGNDGSRGGADRTSVEQATDRRVFAGTDGIPRQESDEVLQAVRAVFDNVATIHHLAVKIRDGLAFIDHVHAKAEGRQTTLSGACACCGREVAGGHGDPMRGGYCISDYRAWDRAGRPDRAAWEIERRQYLAEKAS
jgi:hypothetical protein